MQSTWEKRLFLLPAVFVILAIIIFPFIHNIILSFTNANFFKHTPTQLSISSWARLFHDKYIWIVLKNTLIFVFGGLALQYPVGLLLALIINREDIPGRGFFRSAFLTTMLISPIAAGFIVGRLMFNESIGPLNDILSRIGLSPVPWLSSGRIAQTVLILIDSWQWTPFFMLLLLANLEHLPKDPFEAARVEGATSWQVFRYITFPMLLPISVVAVLIRTLMMFRVMALPRIVTAGGPGSATETVTMYAYNVGIAGGNIAYGAVTASVLLITVIIAVLTFLSVIRKVMRYREI